MIGMEKQTSVSTAIKGASPCKCKLAVLTLLIGINFNLPLKGYACSLFHGTFHFTVPMATVQEISICHRSFLLLFNLSRINPAIPHSITATKVCLKNQAIPPATAKTIPKIPMACFLFTISRILTGIDLN